MTWDYAMNEISYQNLIMIISSINADSGTNNKSNNTNSDEAISFWELGQKLAGG